MLHASTRPDSTEATTAEARSEARRLSAPRDDTDFCLRYAARVLERYARLWHRIDATVRVVALFSGTAAFAALINGSPGWTIAAGLVSLSYSRSSTRSRPPGASMKRAPPGRSISTC
jgi:hypothetical protein